MSGNFDKIKKNRRNCRNKDKFYTCSPIVNSVSKEILKEEKEGFDGRELARARAGGWPLLDHRVVAESRRRGSYNIASYETMK